MNGVRSPSPRMGRRFVLLLLGWFVGLVVTGGNAAAEDEGSTTGLPVDGREEQRLIRDSRRSNRKACKHDVAAGCIRVFSDARHGPLRLFSSSGTYSYGLFDHSGRTVEQEDARYGADCAAGNPVGCFMHALLLEATQRHNDLELTIHAEYRIACAARLPSACNNMIVLYREAVREDPEKWLHQLKLICQGGEWAACENADILAERFGLPE